MEIIKTFLNNHLSTIQIIISVLLIISILLQQTGAVIGAGGVFGGGDVSIQTTRRGSEKFLLKVSTYLAILFFLTSLYALIK